MKTGPFSILTQQFYQQSQSRQHFMQSMSSQQVLGNQTPKGKCTTKERNPAGSEIQKGPKSHEPSQQDSSSQLDALDPTSLCHYSFSTFCILSIIIASSNTAFICKGDSSFHIFFYNFIIPNFILDSTISGVMPLLKTTRSEIPVTSKQVSSPHTPFQNISITKQRLAIWEPQKKGLQRNSKCKTFTSHHFLLSVHKVKLGQSPVFSPLNEQE